mmetsp:Transcript_65386/g.206606  ORF Transcript_65386/g.206606 Transcript_65386/m.206606 type:complete len:121 (-) Transcript_65386:65-427(-)
MQSPTRRGQPSRMSHTISPPTFARRSRKKMRQRWPSARGSGGAGPTLNPAPCPPPPRVAERERKWKEFDAEQLRLETQERNAHMASSRGGAASSGGSGKEYFDKVREDTINSAPPPKEEL